MTEERIFERLRALVYNLDQPGVQETTREALAAGVPAQDIISRGLAAGMQQVGDGYERGDLFVPELLLSARAMQAALEILRPHLAPGLSAVPGTVVLGTARGDVHRIGKSIVSIVLEGAGFTVHDLGEDVLPETFVEKAREVGADVVGISALISLAVSKMAETVALLADSGVTAKVIVGGAAVTEATAAAIGADAYGKDAWDGLRQVRALCTGGLPT